MMEAHSTVTTPRPVPVFDGIDEGVFSTKKERGKTERKYRPPPPPHPALSRRSTFSRSRVRSCLPESRAMAVSFKDDSDSLGVLTNGLYNTDDQLLFVDQCFVEKRLIGSGCFGEVYSARSRLDGKMYAIKKSRQCFRSNADRRRRLEEVRRHERLPPHRHCVAFYGAWEERDHLYMQTELCATSLADLAEADHSISEPTVWAFMVDLLLAVKHLHDNQLAHLDIKPENVFVMREGYCKLGDFGLVMDCSSADLNDSDVTEGDPKYMAPELMQGRFSPAADIFSLGLTVLELACDLELPLGSAGWHLLRSGRLPAPLRGALSPSLREVLEWMLTPDPERRPSADQVLQMPAVRAARTKRTLVIACSIAVSVVRGLLSRMSASTMAVLVFLLWLIRWPVRCVTDRSPAELADRSPLCPTPAPTPTSLCPTPAPFRPTPAPLCPTPAPDSNAPLGWVDPSFSDVDDDVLDLTVEELRAVGPKVRNSTPKLSSVRSTLRSRRGDLVRQELAFGLAQACEEDEEPAGSPWPLPSRRLEDSFNSFCADSSPAVRRRQPAAGRLGGVQVRLDFKDDLSDDE